MNRNVNELACITETSVHKGLVEHAANGQFEDARELKCYFKCYYQNAGYMNTAGKIQADTLRANIPAGISKNMANKAIDLCAVRKGNDACETAYAVQKCLVENNLKY